MAEAGRYKFCVRAIPKDSKELSYVTGSGWVYSDSQSVDADEVSPFVNRSSGSPGREEMTPEDTGWKKDKTGSVSYTHLTKSLSPKFIHPNPKMS